MSLEELYRQVILDHNQDPRYFGRLAEHSASVGLHNPVCGDQLVLDIQVDDGVVTDIGFDGHGCAISMASASMLCEAAVGKPVADADAIAKGFIRFLTTPDAPPPDGDLEVLAGVKKFASRVKCATLAHNALTKAIADVGHPDPAISRGNGDATGSSPRDHRLGAGNAAGAGDHGPSRHDPLRAMNTSNASRGSSTSKEGL